MTVILALLVENWKSVLGAIVGIGLGFGIASATIGPYQHHKGFVAGKEAMAAAVTKQNAVAAEAAGRARSTIDKCFAKGGEWDQENGRCDR